jgi:UDP-glucose 4-epimerase
MPAVPFSAPTDPPFAVIEHNDAARAIVAAARNQLAEPVNVVASGAITALHAIRRGRRIPVPVFRSQWLLAGRLSHMLGAPIPDHVAETLTRGRLADNGRMEELLGITADVSTVEVIDHLYHWPSVVRRPARVPAAQQFGATS